MKIVTVTLAGFGGALLLALSTFGTASAQPDMPAAMPAAMAPTHGDWTLRQREDWLNGQLQKARDDRSLDKASFNSARLEMRDLGREESRMRHDAHGELTANQTAELDTRLDTVASKIHWANMSEHTHPW
jgi:hypothetical protein